MYTQIKSNVNASSCDVVLPDPRTWGVSSKAHKRAERHPRYPMLERAGRAAVDAENYGSPDEVRRAWARVDEIERQVYGPSARDVRSCQHPSTIHRSSSRERRASVRRTGGRPVARDGDGDGDPASPPSRAASRRRSRSHLDLARVVGGVR